MTKSAFALALVLLLLGAQPLFATAPQLSSVFGHDLQPDATARLFADAGWHHSLFTDAQASPVAGPPYPTTVEEAQVPLPTGAWLMAIGLVVFVISRKRFRS